MKNILTFFTLMILYLMPNLINSQELFYKKHLNETTYNEMLASFPNIDTSLIKKNTIFLDLDVLLFDRIINNSDPVLNLEIPFLNESKLNLKLKEFFVYSNFLTVKRQTITGEIIEQYIPKIKTYKVEDNKNIKGVFTFSQQGLKAVLKINNNTYELSSFKGNAIYFINNINYSPIDFDFSCAHDDLEHTDSHNHHNQRFLGSGLGCVDIALEIDFHTFQTFGNYQDAVDWALEMMSVVNELFQIELEIGIKSSSAQVWEIPDPYFSFVNEPQDMLYAIRNNWTNNQSFSNIQRDLVHLFSKRSNTGTGGIAFLNGLTSNLNGYGFSSGLTDDTDYIDLPVPYFFWNIYCLAHELGHNFGARHTQWCGWDGGPIDNCVSYEEMYPGECSNYNSNPGPEVGTIMSYCHTWNFNLGGGIDMKFHNLVKESIMNFTSSQNLNNCTFDVLGCTDDTGCNYDISANIDDNTCIYPEMGYDCMGNCIVDYNQDGICDDSGELSGISGLDQLKIYPNPSTDILKINTHTEFHEMLYFKLFNKLGQLILSKLVSHNTMNVDVSKLSPGLYTVHIINKEKIKTENIIIQ